LIPTCNLHLQKVFVIIWWKYWVLKTQIGNPEADVPNKKKHYDPRKWLWKWNHFQYKIRASICRFK
jgi:hypothetical protein